MSDNKVELIKKVMEEVKDPALRDSILHEITKDKNSGNDSSAIDKAMKEFGITNVNKEAVGEFVVSNTKGSIVAASIFSFLAIIFGFGILLKAGSDSFFILFGSFWILLGSASLFVYARMSKIFKWGE